MGLGLSLTTKPAAGSARLSLDDLERWGRRLGQDVSVTRADASVSLALHPTAEPVEFSLNEAGRLSVSAKTSTAGPGYHAHLVDLLDDLAETLHQEWSPLDEDGEQGDETGYFGSRDYAELERQMLMWLRALAQSMSSHDATDFDVCLSLGYRYEVDAHTRTPLGPREVDYWQAIAADPRRGIDFFAWWERGQQAGYFLGVALALMWTEVRWREPYTDLEESTLRRVDDALRRAYEIDPSRAYPWREWAEVSGFLAESVRLPAEVRKRAASMNGPLIGYRRHPVRVPLTGGWSIRLPGDVAEEWDEEATFHGWAEQRNVWFSAFRHRDPGIVSVEDLRQRSKPGIEAFEWREGNLAGYATLSQAQEEGESYWRLSAETAVASRVALLTVCFFDPADRQWALDVWRSLRQGQQTGK